ncbi:MAG: hypothetical protein GY867_12485 [bacterium]|nr:hypothetical protein [bacterium]
MDSLQNWMSLERNPMRPLNSMLFDSEDLLRWRAIELLGLVAGYEARRDLERVRRQIRRFFWLMNDESGGICWNAPEAIAEMLFNVPGLIEEYGQQLPSFFVEEPFERGSRWAVARLAARERSTFLPAVPSLVKSLDDPDALVRGYSLLGLNALGVDAAKVQATTLVNDNMSVKTYDFESGEFTRTAVGNLARSYLESL